VGCGNITGGTYNALTLTSVATGFTVAGGTTPKTLTLNDDFNASTQLTAIGANTTHRGSVGTDHGYINQDLQTTASPTFVTTKLSGLTDGYVPYHVSDALGLANSGIFWDSINSRVGIGCVPSDTFHVVGISDVVGVAGHSKDLVTFSDSTAQAAGVGAGILLSGKYTDAGAYTLFGAIYTRKDDGADGHYGSSLHFLAREDGDTNLLPDMTILSNGNVGIGTTTPTSILQVVGLPAYANNAAAIAGGLTAGAFYRTGGDPDPVCVVH